MTGRQLATFRLAWRLVRKSRARSLLIALLVAIPVMAGAFAATTIRTAHLSPTESADRQLGSADAIAVVSSKPFHGVNVLGRSGAGETAYLGLNQVDAKTVTGTAWSKLLPAGSRVTPDAWARSVQVTAGDRASEAQGIALDLADPMTHGIYRLVAGSAPNGSGEVAITTKLAAHLHLRLGSKFAVNGRDAAVRAIVENPGSLDIEEVVAPAPTLGGLADPTHSVWYGNTGQWLIDTPAAAPDLHDQLLSKGIVYETRHQWTYPGPELASTHQVDGQVVVVLGTVIGFGLLEILLLAGAAFAVGARRQTHDLGLLAATGGDDTDIRRTVLAQGALLGVGGAIIGLAAGVCAVPLLRGVLERAADSRFGGFDVGATDLAAVAVLGVVAGLLAAIVPARAAAARPVLQMLRDKYDADGSRATLPRWAVMAIVGGVALTVTAATVWHRSANDLRNTFIETGSVSKIAHGLVTLLHDNQWPAVLWLGAAMTLAGLVRACPAVISRLSMLSRSLPVSPRLALRDAGRHRHRTAPAVAAVMTVVAGAVLVLFVASSTDLRDKHLFRLSGPTGTISVQAPAAEPTDPTLTEVAAQTASLVGGGSQAVIGSAIRAGHGQINVRVPHCPADGSGDLAACQYRTVGVIAPQSFDLIAGQPDAVRALDNGHAVVLAPALAEGGSVVLKSGGPGRGDPVRVPALVLSGQPDYGLIPLVYVSPDTAAAHGWRVQDDLALVKPDHTPSTSVMDRAQHALGNQATINLQEPYHSRYSTVLLAMLGAAGIATLAGTSIAVALAMAESRSDMATMAAVGASPIRRRVHAMSQAAIVGGVGTGLGVGLGALVAIATLAGSERFPTSTPFRWLAAVLVAAPILAIAVAGLATRSRVTLTRRIA